MWSCGQDKECRSPPITELGGISGGGPPLGANQIAEWQGERFSCNLNVSNIQTCKCQEIRSLPTAWVSSVAYCHTDYHTDMQPEQQKKMEIASFRIHGCSTGLPAAIENDIITPNWVKQRVWQSCVTPVLPNIFPLSWWCWRGDVTRRHWGKGAFCVLAQGSAGAAVAQRGFGGVGYCQALSRH